MNLSRTSSFVDIKKKLSDKSLKVGIVGAGYVGLPLGILIARNGFNVCCIDVNETKIDCLREGISYISEISNDELKDVISSGRFTVSVSPESYEEFDAIIVALPTPSNPKTNLPDTSILEDAFRDIYKTCKPNTLFVFESTVQVSFTASLIETTTSETGVEKDCFYCFSPERVDPGNKNYQLSEIPKIIAGDTKLSVDLLSAFYSHFFDHLEVASSIAAAEFTKLFENVHRAVNIALVNEIADTSSQLGLDTQEILRLAATKPFGYTPYYPNAGVGGHCIPVDPVYYLNSISHGPISSPIVALSHMSNINRPKKFAEYCNKLMDERGLKSILVVGYAYKPNVSDSRNSAGKNIVKHFLSTNKLITVFDTKLDDTIVHNGNVIEFLTDINGVGTIFDLAIVLCLHSDMDIETIKSKSKIQIYGSTAIK